MGRLRHLGPAGEAIYCAIKNNRLALFITAVATIVLSMMAGFTIYLSKPLIDYFAAGDVRMAFLFFLAAYAAIPFLRDITSWLISNRMAYFSTLVSQDIRRRVMNGVVMNGPGKENRNILPGKLTSLLITDVSIIEAFLLESLPMLVQAVFNAISSGVVLFVISPSMALIALVTLPIHIIRPRLVTKKLEPYWRQMNVCRDRLAGTSGELAAGIETLRVYSMREYAVARLSKSGHDFAMLLRTSVSQNRKWNTIGNIVSMLPMLIVIWGLVFFQRTATIGAVVATINAYTALLAPISTISSSHTAFARARLSMERLGEIAGVERDVCSSVALESRDIRLCDVSVLADRVEILQRVNVCISYGTTVLVTGASGQGKTTLIRTVAGLIEPSAGSVEIGILRNGCQDYESKPHLIAYQSQVPVVFSDSMRANIDSLTSISEDELLALLKELELGHISSSPLSDCQVNPSQLSEGERMRVALARLVCRSASVCLLDEPFAPLDPLTARKVWNAMRTRLPESTFVVVCHNAPDWLVPDMHIEVRDRGIQVTECKKGRYKNVEIAGQ